MKSNQRISGFLTLCSVAMLFVAGVNQMEPAKNALDSINATLNSVSTDAQKYVPDQFAQAQSKVAELTASYEKKDYTAVVVGAPAILTQVNGLAIPPGQVEAPASASRKDDRNREDGNRRVVARAGRRRQATTQARAGYAPDALLHVAGIFHTGRDVSRSLLARDSQPIDWTIVYSRAAAIKV
jgi:hypothetical protein